MLLYSILFILSSSIPLQRLSDTNAEYIPPPPIFQIRRRRPTPATLVASSDQSSPGKTIQFNTDYLHIQIKYCLTIPVFCLS